MNIKREGLWLFSLVFVLILIQFVLAASSIESQVGDAEKTVKDVDKFFTREDVRTQFFKDKWTAFSTNNAFGIWLASSHNYLLNKSDFFYLFFGVAYGFTFNFWLTMIFFITLTVFFFRISRGFLFFLMMSMYFILKKTKKGVGANKFLWIFRDNTISNIADFWIFLLFFGIFVVVKIPYFLANFFSQIFFSEGEIMMRIIYLGIAVIVISIFYLFGSYFNKIVSIKKRYYEKYQRLANIEDSVKKNDSNSSGNLSSEEKKLLAAISDSWPRIMKHIEEEDGDEDEENKEVSKMRKEAERQAQEDIGGMSDEI
jgi:hypothetical protein